MTNRSPEKLSTAATATLPIEVTTPVVVALLGRVIVTGSPTLTSPWSETSRAIVTTGVREVALKSAMPPETT